MKDFLLKRWKRILSKLSQPITPKSPFFSQETAQLIFIFIIFIIINDIPGMIDFSHSMIGHISVLSLLFYFTLVHPMAGALLSMMMILYYHTDLVKAYYYDAIFYKNIPSTIQEQFEDPPIHYIESLRNMEASTIDSAYPFTTNVQTIPSKPSYARPSFFKEFNTILTQEEGFTSIHDENDKYFRQKEYGYSRYQPTYEDKPTAPSYSIRQSEIVYDSNYAEKEAQQNAAFRQEHCNAKHQLIHKDTVVNPSMAEHIFPELQIEGSEYGRICNPCDVNCNIHISKIDRRLNTEHILQQRNQPSLQKTSSDWVPTWFDIFLPHPVFQLSTEPFAKPSNYS